MFFSIISAVLVAFFSILFMRKYETLKRNGYFNILIIFIISFFVSRALIEFLNYNKLFLVNKVPCVIANPCPLIIIYFLVAIVFTFLFIMIYVFLHQDYRPKKERALDKSYIIILGSLSVGSNCLLMFYSNNNHNIGMLSLIVFTTYLIPTLLFGFMYNEEEA